MPSSRFTAAAAAASCSFWPVASGFVGTGVGLRTASLDTALTTGTPTGLARETLSPAQTVSSAGACSQGMLYARFNSRDLCQPEASAIGTNSLKGPKSLCVLQGRTETEAYTVLRAALSGLESFAGFAFAMTSFTLGFSFKGFGRSNTGSG